MNRQNVGNILLIAALITATMLAGCGAVQGFFRDAIGAPSAKEIAAQQEKIQKAAEDRELLTEQERVAQREKQQAEAAAAALQARREEARATYAALSSQLQTLSGAAFDAADAMLTTLRAQMRELDAAGQQQALVVQSFRERADLLGEAITATNAKIDAAQRRLAQIDEETAAAIGRAGDTITGLGAAASGMGIPGAGAVATGLASVTTLLLGNMLGKRSGQTQGELVASRKQQDSLDKTWEEAYAAGQAAAEKVRQEADKAWDESQRQAATANQFAQMLQVFNAATGRSTPPVGQAVPPAA